MIMVPYLIQKNDIVDIVLPATPLTITQTKAVKKYLEQKLELKPRIFLEENETKISPSLTTNEFPLASAEMRFEQLYKALGSDSKIVWCARGGYGSGDLLPFLAKAKKIIQTKIFIGFSDIVSIATFLQQEWGWQILCAPVLIQLANDHITLDATQELEDIIFGRKNLLTYNLTSLQPQIKLPKKSIDAKITGGCLSVICGHFGGQYQIDFANKILFLEDEGEDGERLDRYFRQIIEVILKTNRKPKAILLGNFLEANIYGSPKANNINIAIKRFIEKIERFKLKIPVFEVKEKNLGHSKNMRPLILGLKAELNPGKKLLKLVTDQPKTSRIWF